MTTGNQFADLALARRIELCSAWRGVRYTEAYGRLHPQASCAVLPVGGGYAIYVAPGSPVNSARGLGLSGPVSEAELEEVERFYRSRGQPTRLHLCPLADESLLELVHRRGYHPISFFSALVYPIPPDFSPAPVPEGFRIVPARPEEAEVWLRAVAEGFEETDSPSPEAFDILGPNFHADESVPFFAWAADGQPAGGGGMYVAPRERAIELGGASTRLAYRRRGVQRALIEARLAEALRRGCDLAMVLTEPGSHSQRNLQRAGFWLAYTKVVVEKSA